MIRHCSEWLIHSQSICVPICTVFLQKGSQIDGIHVLLTEISVDYITYVLGVQTQHVLLYLLKQRG